MKQDQIVIYQTEDGQTQIDVRLENEVHSGTDPIEVHSGTDPIVHLKSVEEILTEIRETGQLLNQ